MYVWLLLTQWISEWLYALNVGRLLLYDVCACVCVWVRSDNVLVRRCDKRCVVNKCGIDTFLNVIIHVIVKYKVMALSMIYELYNHTTIRPFKDNELIHDEYYNEIHCGNPTSWITLRCDELKWFWKQLSCCVYCIVQTKVAHIWF